MFNSMVRSGAFFPTVISPLAYVSKHAFVGPGTVVMHGVIINAGATVGSNCIINTNAHIEHDAVIGDHCHIATGAIVNGGVRWELVDFVGSGAVIKQYCEVPHSTFIKACSIYK